jgi:hypothetical protein
MTLTQKLDDVMRELSLLPNTRSTYHGWVRAFYRFNGISPLDVPVARLHPSSFTLQPLLT